MTTISDMVLGSNNAPITQEPSISDNILSTPSTDIPKVAEQFNIDQAAAKNRSAFVRGMRDILDTGAHGLAKTTSAIADVTLPESISGPIRQSKDEMLAADKAELDKYNLQNPPSSGLLPNSGETSRLVGQTVATLPLMPIRAFNAISSGMRALPTITATGEKIAAPLLNRLGAASVTGGLGGAEYGALTASTNDKSTLENVGEGLITGALAGPILTTAATAGQKLLPTINNMWANVQINKLAKDAGMEPSAVKNIIEILQNAGYTPKEAQLKLNKLGPQATLADLAQSIQTEASGLASFGGKPTEILKGRYEARSQTANSAAHDLMEQKLGIKPNIEAEKEAIITKAQNEVKPDYQAAYNSGAKLDISDVAANIDNQLKNAVGPKAAALTQLKSFLYDSEGNLKNSVPQLHEIRQAIDDVLSNKNPTTSYGKNAVRAINDVREGLDTKLKTVPEMEAADNKFASKMQIVNDIDTGYNVLKNGMNKEEFGKFFDGLTPERQDAIRKGLRGAIGDLMEKASRGELSEAQRLFGKNSANRANLEKVFGNDGTEVLDALQKEANERFTERSVMHGAQTAERQAVQRKYGERNDGPGAGQILHGMVLDVISGTPGGATALMTAKRAGTHFKMQLSEGRRERLIEGTADLLSRQGPERNLALDVANKANKINNLIGKSKLPIKDLPNYLISAPIGELSYSSYKKLGSE